MLLPNEPDALRGRAGHAFASMAGLFLTRKPPQGPRKNQAISANAESFGWPLPYRLLQQSGFFDNVAK